MNQKKPNHDFPKSPGFPRPSDYMRNRHPELFSDTHTVTVPILDKSFLGYHLETLTKRKQELEFEEFSRRLAELTICPNIKPQTGPIGGGDSKVDASTYPVAPLLAERYYTGNPNPPSEDLWGFAFSCKAEWKSKLKSDMEKISLLKRKFAKVFFISNQFIPDKSSSDLEIELGNKHGFELHILDRSWIVSQIIEHKHENLAIEILGIRSLEVSKPHMGPRDIEHQLKLDSLLQNLRKPERYHGNDFALALDYLNAAKLSRNLEKDRSEIDGLFHRAELLAKKTKYGSLFIRCGYDHAWTSLWWFDDPIALEEIYAEIEPYISGITDAEDCELFSNLWLLLYGSVNAGTLQAEKGKLDSRLSAVRDKLTGLSKDTRRPSNSLRAETCLYLLDLNGTLEHAENAPTVFSGLKSCLIRSQGLGLYPLMEVIDNLSELGEFFGHLPGYDSLFEEICKISKERLSETTEGRLLFTRGMQLVSSGDTREILRVLGLARLKLAKEETLQYSIRAALTCSDAYRSIGYFWAARMESLFAAQVALRNWRSISEFFVEGVLATIQLAWLELMLGRIAPFLAWHHLSNLLVGQMRVKQYNVAKLENDLIIQDAALGCFLLNLGPQDLRDLVGFENVQSHSIVPSARQAYLYSVGRVSEILTEFPEEYATSEEKVEDFFEMWKTQPASKQMPRNLTQEVHTYSTYETTIMGVKYRIKMRNSFGLIVFSENVIGVIEAALALAKWENLAFIQDVVDIFVDIGQFGNDPPELRIEHPPDPSGYRFIWKNDPIDWFSNASRNDVIDYFKLFLFKHLLDITIDPFQDLKEELGNWQKDETFSRALSYSPISIFITGLIGKDSYELALWTKASTSQKI